MSEMYKKNASFVLNVSEKAVFTRKDECERNNDITETEHDTGLSGLFG